MENEVLPDGLNRKEGETKIIAERLKIVAAYLVLMVCSLISGPAHATEWLNAEERIAFRFVMHAYEYHYLWRMKNVEVALSNYNQNTRLAVNRDRAFDAMCELTTEVIRFETTDSDPAQIVSKYIWPNSFSLYLDALVDVTRAGNKYKHKFHCYNLTWDEHLEFVYAIRRLRSIVFELQKRTGNELYQRYEWSNTFSVEIIGLPLKLEFFEGSAKLKFTKSVGPFKFDFQTGAKRSKSAYSGLSVLQLVLPSGRYYMFDVTGVDFDIEAPISKVSVRGSWLTLTCDNDCSKDLKQRIAN